MSSRARANIRKRGETYTYYVYVVGADGRRRQVSRGGFRTRREAEAARVEVLTTIQTGTFVRAERTSVARFLVDEWLPTRRPPNLEESTYESYERDIRLHVIPYIGGIPLQKLSPMDLNALYRTLLDKGRRGPHRPTKRHSISVVDRARQLRAAGLTYQAVAERLALEFPEQAANITRYAVAALLRRSRQAQAAAPTKASGLKPRTVRYIHTIVHAALKDALRWNRVARNVADAATPPPVGSARSPRPPAWTADELSRFLGFVAASRYLPAWVFLATTGCRRGECLGITWHDLDLDRVTAVMSQQVTVVHGELLIKPLPKSKRAHLIRLDSATVDLLRGWRARQNEERLLAGPGYDDLDLAFCHPDGRPYQPNRFSREFLRKQEQFNRAQDRPLPRLVLHGLRHTWATLALEEGIDIKIVSERLNHSSTHITREIYTHVTPPMQSDAAERVAARIFLRPPS